MVFPGFVNDLEIFSFDFTEEFVCDVDISETRRLEGLNLAWCSVTNLTFTNRVKEAVRIIDLLRNAIILDFLIEIRDDTFTTKAGDNGHGFDIWEFNCRVCISDCS